MIINDNNFYIEMGKPLNNTDFQWELLDLNVDSDETFGKLWNKFKSNNKVRSCICMLNNVDFLTKFEFKYINGFYSYFPFGILYRIDDLNDGSF